VLLAEGKGRLQYALPMCYGQVYERAIGNVPLPLDAPAKRFWQRYIYLWLNYAVWEELEAEDAERTREVYRNCLKLIPHDIFTFAKVGCR
jgi:crooked neck